MAAGGPLALAATDEDMLTENEYIAYQAMLQHADGPQPRYAPHEYAHAVRPPPNVRAPDAETWMKNRAAKAGSVGMASFFRKQEQAGAGRKHKRLERRDHGHCNGVLYPTVAVTPSPTHQMLLCGAAVGGA